MAERESKDGEAELPPAPTFYCEAAALKMYLACAVQCSDCRCAERGETPEDYRLP